MQDNNNSVDAVAIISYPGHCLTTIATIKNILELTNWSIPFYIFIDDQGSQYNSWPNYTSEFKTLLQINFPNRDFILHHFSEFNFSHIWDGWLRQQMVKLNLEKYLPGDIWYVTDGDVKLDQLLEFGRTPFNFLTDPAHLINLQNEAYLKHMLKISNPRIRYNNQPVFTHFAPFRYVQKHHLVELKRFVSKQVVNDFNLEHFNLMKQERIIGFGPTPDHYSMTEWDLIEVFRSMVLNDDLGLQYWIMERDWDTRKRCDQTPIPFWSFFGTDRDIDYKWFEDQQLCIPKNIETQIKTISRT